MHSPSVPSSVVLAGSEIAVICDSLDWALARQEAEVGYISALLAKFPTSEAEATAPESTVADLAIDGQPLLTIDLTVEERTIVCALLGMHAASLDTWRPDASEVDQVVDAWKAERIRTVRDYLEGGPE